MFTPTSQESFWYVQGAVSGFSFCCLPGAGEHQPADPAQGQAGWERDAICVLDTHPVLRTESNEVTRFCLSASLSLSAVPSLSQRVQGCATIMVNAMSGRFSESFVLIGHEESACVREWGFLFCFEC